MKTYLFNAINKYKKFSETLEVKKAICDKAWWVFNDSGEKELYIFQEDGTLYITLSGKVSNGTWKYIPANKSIIISANKQSYMVHAAFIDDCIFALQVDGTKEYAFLIDERNKQNFLPKTYSDVINYFIAKEKKYLEEQKRLQMLILQQEKEEEERLAEAKKRQQEDELRERAEEIKGGGTGPLGCLVIVVMFISPVLWACFIAPPICEFLAWEMGWNEKLVTILCLVVFSALSLLALMPFSNIWVTIERKKERKRCEKWKKEHPDDPVNKYLD